MASRGKRPATARKPARRRPPVLGNLSPDWYWEQDADYRFTKVVLREGVAAAERGLAASLVGKKRWETGMEIEGGWDAHRAVLDARRSFRDLLMWRDLDDGSRRWVNSSGEPVFDARGRFTGYRGIGRDVSEQKRAEAQLRESEARFRALTELSSDWYWEQDAEYRFTRLEGRNPAGHDRDLAARLMGQPRWGSGLDCEGGWRAHRALLDARQPFYNVLMWRKARDGSLRYVRISGEPVFDVQGRFTGYRGVGHEITAEKRGELLLRLEHEAARALAVAADAASGVRGVLRAICEAEGMLCGRYFALDEAAGVLRFTQAWHVSDPDIERFVEASHGLVYREGQGLTGAVWQRAEPVWSRDMQSDPRTHAKALVEASGIRGVFAFPALSEGKVLGVLVFAAKDAREPDERLLQSARVVGGQVGQFLRGKQAEESLRDSEARFRSLTKMSSDFFWETDAEHRVASVSHSPEYTPTAKIIGQRRWEVPYIGSEDIWTAHRARLDQRLPFRDFEFARPLPDGGVRYLLISGEPRFAADGRFLGYRGVGRDVTEIALARERIATLAYSDPLTGLANRTSLGPSLEQAVQRARRRGAKLALVFLDLDGFKEVNDLHGHDAGDALLVEVAARLRAHLRASDLLVRLGGDEFLVVLEEVTELAPVDIVARKLLGEMRRPFALPGAQVGVTASIGISVFPDDAADGAALMKHADSAMYAAKQAGKDCLAFYTSGPAANEPQADKRPGAA